MSYNLFNKFNNQVFLLNNYVELIISQLNMFMTQLINLFQNKFRINKI